MYKRQIMLNSTGKKTTRKAWMLFICQKLLGIPTGYNEDQIKLMESIEGYSILFFLRKSKMAMLQVGQKQNLP